MTDSLTQWLIGVVGTLLSLLLGCLLWVLRDHSEQLRIIRQRLHEALNGIAELKAINYMRDKK